MTDSSNAPLGVKHSGSDTAHSTALLDMHIVPSTETPNWLRGHKLPPGWRVGTLAASQGQPWRIAVIGARADNGWDGCETVTTFRFTGVPAPAQVQQMLVRALESNSVCRIQTVELAVPRSTGVRAVRGHGRINVANREMWVQFTFFTIGSTSPHQGRLVQQCLYIDADRETALRDDIIHLGDSLHDKFIASLAGVSRSASQPAD